VLTVQSLLDELDLELAAGSDAAAAPVRWVHISELQDPTPWLSGGEVEVELVEQALDGEQSSS
jgi:purine catabolism regulator